MATPTCADALAQCAKTKSVWCTHPNFYTISATENFSDKIGILNSILRAQTIKQATHRLPPLEPCPCLKVKKVHKDAISPMYATSGAAGLDLFSNVDRCIGRLERKLIPTGICVIIPEGYYGRVAARSGLSVYSCIDVGAGVVDSDYRGEICVLLINNSNMDFVVKKGNRIAQLICEKICHPVVMEELELNETVRGNAGFGSTGK